MIQRINLFSNSSSGNMLRFTDKYAEGEIPDWDVVQNSKYGSL